MVVKLLRCSLLVLLLVNYGSCQAFDIDWSLCDTEAIYSAECEMKVAQCGIVNSIIEGPLGSLISQMGICTKAMGIMAPPELYAALGNAYMTRTPEAVIAIVTKHYPLQLAIKQCIFNSTGLATSEGKMNRTLLVERIQSHLYFDPVIAFSLSVSANICPEPLNYDLDPFIGCLRDSCLNSVPGLAAIVRGLSIFKPNKLLMSNLPTNMPFIAGGGLSI